MLLLRMNVLEVGRVAVRRLPVGTARVLTRGRGRCCRGCHVGGVELLGRGRLGRGMRSLGRAPVGAVLLVTQVIHLHSRLRVEGVDGVALRLVRPLSLRCRGRPRAVGHLHVQHGHALRRPRVRPADVGVVSWHPRRRRLLRLRRRRALLWLLLSSGALLWPAPSAPALLLRTPGRASASVAALWSSSGAVVPVPGSAAPSALLLLRLLVRVHVDPPSRDGGRFTLSVHSVSRLTYKLLLLMFRGEAACVMDGRRD